MEKKKINKEIIKQAADELVKTCSIAEVCEWLNADGWSEKQSNAIIEKAKDFIKESTAQVADIQKDINIYKLNKLATKARADKDKLTAIDILNKINGLYTQKIELTDRNFKFILGDEQDDGFLKDDVNKAMKQLKD